MKTIGVLTAAALFVIGSAATAQLAHAQQNEGTAAGAGTTDYSTEGLEPRPTPPSPVVNAEKPGVQLQAGVGSDTAFAHAGVVELGGSAGLTIASALKSFDLSPSVGYFIADNLQLSVLSGITYVKAKGVDGSAFARLLLEPSYHLPFNDTIFGFLGVGLGATYAEDPGFGFALAPRVGLKVMVGRSGILTPSISWLYSTNDLAAGGAPGAGQSSTTTATISSALVVNLGYTVML